MEYYNTAFESYKLRRTGVETRQCGGEENTTVWLTGIGFVNDGAGGMGGADGAADMYG
jgi:hypothetical protein